MDDNPGDKTTDLGRTSRNIIRSLKTSEGKSHSNSFADYAISEAGVKLSLLKSCDKQGKMLDKRRKLKKAGWDGITCIDCGNEIPLPRREAMPTCYRCVPCQEIHEQKK